METKKWPVLAQILIALGAVGSLLGVVAGLSQSNILVVIFSIVGLVIYWNVYKLKKWALIGLTVLLSLNIVSNILNIFAGVPILIAAIGIGFSILLLVYFNSAQIKKLFEPDVSKQE